ncbi:hypothetical protein CH54_1491 [Yersinia rochesterensis]|uniref:Uncharacterized protein n=1 Tax=Yersinia rochesterensis TaxID=1604335 RepID=A0ABM5SIK7_9GAMM|nr:hypothetical protein DJ57_2339 [Yersinia rochesterensis]AJI85951.1 hypothetical protein AW19_172 [Yersinia frederiksenii Y225]AJJ34212.1 hypothetical protein CH54_1491 [Yersinia rochesterensis]CNH04643.1 Uncharacterised protein [Yersinia kristensenii]CRY60256.1 Uncharacterised protein [Yersinia kristensenii]
MDDFLTYSPDSYKKKMLCSSTWPLILFFMGIINQLGRITSHIQELIYE